MKRILIFFIILLTITTARAAWNFTEGTKYYFSFNYAGGYLCIGANHEVSYPLYYQADSSITDDGYWYIAGDDVNGYTIQNASTGQYLCWTSDHDTDRYMNLTDADDGSTTRWTFTHTSGGYTIIYNVSQSSYFFNLRTGTYQVGTYAGSSAGTNSQVNILDESGLSPWTDDADDTTTSSYDTTIEWTSSGETYHQFNDWTSSNTYISSSSSTYTVTFTTLSGSHIYFDWSVSSESCCDILLITLDGTDIVSSGGTESNTYTSDALTTGQHTIVFTYSKDGSVDTGSDQATITNFFVTTSEAQTLTVHSINSSTNEEFDTQIYEFYDTYTLAAIPSQNHYTYNSCSVAIPYSTTTTSDIYIYYDPQEIVKTTTITSNGTFAEETIWYRMIIRSTKYIYDSNGNALCNSTTAQYDPTYFWCFSQDTDGYYTVYNMQEGPTNPLTASSYANQTYLTLSESGTYQKFNLTENSNGGYNLQIPGYVSCANDFYGAGTLALWYDSSAPSDNGSNIVFEEVGEVTLTGIDELAFTEEEVDMMEKSTATLSYSYSPADATLTGVTWSSSNASVATVNINGEQSALVTATGAGDATIRVTSTNDNTVYAECNIHVTALTRVSSITVQTTAKINIGKSLTLPVSVEPSDAYNTSFSVTSSNTSIVTADASSSELVLTGVAAGEAIVTVSACDDSGQYAQCQVTVVDPNAGTLLEHSADAWYLAFPDSALVVLPKDLVTGEPSVTNGHVSACLVSGRTLQYTGVVTVSDKCPYVLPTFTSYKFNNKFNYQLFTDVIASDPTASEINLEAGCIGKWLTASFQLPSDRCAVWVDGELQDSKNTRIRFDHSIDYTIGYSNWRQLEILKRVDSTYVEQYTPFGHKTTVTVDFLADHPSNDYYVPEIYITVDDGSNITDKTTLKDAHIEIKGGGVYPDFAQTAVQIKGRGNTSWGGYGSKNPYRLKFDTKQKPLGMTKGKSWILLANKQASSMTTNAIGQKIASLMGSEYPCHIVPVELYINGTYQGSYNFCEKVGLSNNNVALDDDTNAAMMELDTYSDDGETPNTENAYGINVKINDPDVEDEDYDGPLTWDGIFSDFNLMTQQVALGTDAYTGYVDVDALVNYLATCELMCNCELKHPKSVFCYSEDVTDAFDPTGKDPTPWKFGPLWDCDWAFGYENSYGYFEVNQTDDYFSTLIGSGTPKQFWNALRYNSTEVDKAYFQRWHEFMYGGGLDELIDFCDDYYQYAARSLAHNSSGQFTNDANDYSEITTRSKEWLKARAQHIYESITHYEIASEETSDGDVNNDGRVSISDVTYLISIVLGIEEDRYETADVTGDGVVNRDDVLYVAKKLVTR